QPGVVGLALRALAVDELDRAVGRDDALVEQRALLEEAHHVVAVLGAQGRRPALVLLEQAREALPARVGELERLAVAVGDVELVELVREQELLELGLALDVALVAPLL